MMARKPRTTAGLVTVINPELRIVNGDVMSLRKLRKRGRPKKVTTDTVVPSTPSTPDYPTYDDIQEFDGFHAVRSRKEERRRKKLKQTLQDKFNELCSEPREVEVFFSDGVSRIEKSAPSSFCSCSSNTGYVDEDGLDHDIACMVHGVKLNDCVCGGIDGFNGYRSCAGHRENGMIVGVAPFETERMRVAKVEADKVAREIGWI